MVHVSSRRIARLFAAAGLTLAGLLLLARPAQAQYWIAPDRSIVYVGPAQPYPVFSNFNVTPVAVPGSPFVRVGGNYSAQFVNPMSVYPGTGFIKPFTATERARASNFYGSPTYNPNPILTGPFQKWW